MTMRRPPTGPRSRTTCPRSRTRRVPRATPTRPAWRSSRQEPRLITRAPAAASTTTSTTTPSVRTAPSRSIRRASSSRCTSCRRPRWRQPRRSPAIGPACRPAYSRGGRLRADPSTTYGCRNGGYAMTGPLAGVHVLDLARVLAGPYAAMLLGDLGAEVIKVERPGAGDDTRHWGPPFVQAAGDAAASDRAESTYFLSVNRGKRSAAIDLKDPGEREFVEALVRWADVLIENFRPGVMDRLGLSDDRLAELNPRLIRLSISGFGEKGPDRDRVGYDQILQAEGGVMSLTGTAASRNVKVGVPIADISAALFGVIGVLGA